MKDKSLLLTVDRNYCYGAIKDVFDENKIIFKNNILLKVLKHIDAKIVSVPEWLVRLFFRKHDYTNYSLVFVSETFFPLSVVKNIRECNKKCRIIYWLWNPIVEKNVNGAAWEEEKYYRDLIRKRNEYNYEIWSFDKENCKKYNFAYNTQVCPYRLIEACVIKYDVIFVGKDKNRMDVLKKLASVFREKEMKYKFLIQPIRFKKYKNIEKEWLMDKEMTYYDVLNLEMAGKCILDLPQEKQNGLTWRPLEALFYKKKLITSFKEIVKYDFYNKKNIFIIDVDDYERIYEFVSSPYYDVPPEIVDKYKAKKWRENFDVEV